MATYQPFYTSTNDPFFTVDNRQFYVPSFIVTYNSNGGSSVQPFVGEILPTPLPTPTRAGYTFGGWFYDAAFINEAHSGDYLHGDTTLFAKWSEPTYTITYNSNGGSYVEPETGSVLPTPLPDTVRSGYIFIGWFYDSSFNTEAFAGDVLSGNVTLFAKWDTGIVINVYRNTAEPDRVDKTSFLTSVGYFTGVLRDECNISRPSILIQQNSLPLFNYAYISVFGRWYFVGAPTSVRKGIWRLELTTDVLMTYKNGIYALDAVIARQENDFNNQMVDNLVPTEKEPIVEVTEITNTVLDNQLSGNAHNIVITVVGA